MKKAVLIDHIHAMQDNIALFTTATYSADWVIGLLSQIAMDVANLELDNDEQLKQDDDQQGF